MNQFSSPSDAEPIRTGNICLGIELGSTRIKAVLIGKDQLPIAAGSHQWENSRVDGMWTYPLEEVWTGLQSCFADVQDQVHERFGLRIQTLRGLGVSAMMHGYLVLDAEGELLTPFRTWRNTITAEASEELTELFDFPIPQRWSIAHLRQAILNKEAHVKHIAHLTTLSGYVHWKLTGERVLGVGEASGMFPVIPGTGAFRPDCIDRFEERIAGDALPWNLQDLLPEVRLAGESAGLLTASGAALLDPSGSLKAGSPMCPPEGDAGTGMVATNSVGIRMGNVSAGTSVFAMIVLEKALSQAHPEIDLVTTPDGKPVGMVHANNCSSDLDAWIGLFGQVAAALGLEAPANSLYDRLLPLALEGDADCGGLLSYGYVSGEHITGFEEGRPMLVRSPDSRLTLANLLRAHLFSALGALRVGLDILRQEGVEVEQIRGHGGFFKTPEVGQRIMAAATGVPVSVQESAGEGGAWGIALLAAFAVRENRRETLPEFLQNIFDGSQGEPLPPDPRDVAGFNTFFERYLHGLPIERAAVDSFR